MNGLINRRGMLQGGAAALALSGSPAFAAWPDRNIVIQHGFAAGGNADVVARIVGEALAGIVKGQFVVEPKPGAGGTIAAASIARSSPSASAAVSDCCATFADCAADCDTSPIDCAICSTDPEACWISRFWRCDAS